MKPYQALLLLLCLHLSHVDAWGRKQRITVRGRLVCAQDPPKAANVRIKLVDEDTGPDPDDTLDRGRTDENGNFRLSGSTSEWTRIDPFLKIYHDCNDGLKPCQRKWKIEIPKAYIDGEPFDIGILNLEMIMPDESRDCIH